MCTLRRLQNQNAMIQNIPLGLWVQYKLHDHELSHPPNHRSMFHHHQNRIVHHWRVWPHSSQPVLLGRRIMHLEQGYIPRGRRTACRKFTHFTVTSRWLGRKVDLPPVATPTLGWTLLLVSSNSSHHIIHLNDVSPKKTRQTQAVGIYSPSRGAYIPTTIWHGFKWRIKYCSFFIPTIQQRQLSLNHHLSLLWPI